MSTEMRFELTKFEGNNYTLWRDMLETVLTAKGLLGYVNGTIPMPSKDEDVDQWRKKDAEAKLYVKMSVSDAYKPLLLGSVTSKQAIDKISQAYNITSEIAKQTLWQKFFEHSIAPHESMASYLASIELLARQLRDAGETVSDTCLTTQVLRSLPDKYRSLRQSFKMLENSRKTIATLTEMLLQEDAELIARDEAKAAFKAKVRLNQPRSSVTEKANAGKAIGGKSTSSQAGKAKNNLKCWTCGEEGHMKRDCPDRKQQKSITGGQTQRSEENYTKRQAFCSLTNAGHHADDHFLADSAASMHMCRNAELFTSMDETDVKVKVANKQYMQATARGTINIQVNINGKLVPKQLKDVLYCPELDNNLFSLPAMRRQGFDMSTRGNRMYFMKNNVTAITAKFDGDMYVMDMIIQKPIKSHSAQLDSLRAHHRRMGHINVGTILRTAKLKAVIGLEGVEAAPEKFTCNTCNMGKQPRQQHPTIESHVTRPLELVHSDVCGPMPISSPSGSRYFIVFKDEFTNYRVVYTMRHKSDVPDQWKRYVTMSERQTGLKVKAIRSDNGLEYNNQTMKLFNQEHGIVHEFSAPYTPESNGRAEREIRTIVECARSMLIDSGLAEELWSEATHCAAYILNRTIGGGKTTPFELWFKRKPNIHRIKTFGSVAFMSIPKIQRKKWDERARKLVLVGYDQESQNYRLWDIERRHIEIARDVVIRDGIMIADAKKPNTYSFGLHDEEEKDTNTQSVPKNGDDDSEPTVNKENKLQDHKESKAMPEAVVSMPERQTRSSTQKVEHLALDHKGRAMQIDYNKRETSQIPEHAKINTTALIAKVTNSTRHDECIDYTEARLSPEWRTAMEEEIDILQKNGTWELCKLPPGELALPNKWVFKTKPNSDGTIVRYRARLVAGGHRQRQGTQYDEVFSPVVRYDSIRILMSIAAQYNMHIIQFDVKCAYIYGDLDKVVYMKQPMGFEDPDQPDLVCKLIRSLYGCKQSGRCWNQKFVAFMRELNFEPTNADCCVFISTKNDIPVYVCLYVDDGLIISPSKDEIKHTSKALETRFKIKITNVDGFVGMKISIDRNTNTITISQSNYISQLLERFGMLNARPVGTPMDVSVHLTKPVETAPEPHVPYREAVGALLFVAMVSRPDIAFAVGQASRYLSHFNQTHWNAIKHIMRYLLGTMDYALVYRGTKNDLQIMGYTDADFGGCQDTRRSTTGFCFLINGTAVTWTSRRQTIVSLSTTESEYVALTTGAKDAIWISNFLEELGHRYKPLPIMVDNQSAIKLVSNPEFHRRTKHLDIAHHFVRDIAKRGDISVNYVSTGNNVSDILTKNLSKNQILKFCSMLGLSVLYNVSASGGVELGALNNACL